MSFLYLAAGLYLLFEMWRGWRRGVVRHGVSTFALLASGGVGWIFAWMTGAISDRIIPLPPPGGRAIFGLAAALAFYAAAVVLSSLLFKKTSQQNSGFIRLFYGAGGAFFGLIFGLLILWGGVTMFRTLGAVAEGRQAVVADYGGSTSAPLDPGLAGVKGALEQGVAGRLLERVDILPTSFYGLLTKLVRVSGSPGAAGRFFAYPGMNELLAQPKLAALFADPEISSVAAQGNYLALLGNAKLIQVAGDPEVQKSFAAFDWEKALDYALQEPATSPAP